MLKNLTILVLVLTAQSLIAQDGFPKPILYNGDTIVAYTPEQVKIINYNKDSYDECVDEAKSLTQEIEFVRGALNKSKQYEVEISNKDRNQREIIDKQNQQIELHEESKRKLENKVSMAKKMRTVWTSVGTAVGFYVGNKLSSIIKL